MGSSLEFEPKKDPEAVKPLEAGLRADLERALEADLGGVRIHADETAFQCADRLGASAFTRQQEVYFARGQYRPDTAVGKALLAHELAHAAQQGKAEGEPARHDSLETEAEQAALDFSAGRAAPVRLRAPAGGIQKQEKAKQADPSVQKHSDEIGATPAQGTISGGGYNLAYLYNLSKDAAQVPLTLQIPEGVAVVVTPLTPMAEGSDYRVQNAGGTKARALVVSVAKHLKGTAKIQLTMTRGSSSYIVVFQFPTGPAKA